jgi:hypothetical protein
MRLNLPACSITALKNIKQRVAAKPVRRHRRNTGLVIGGLSA